MSVIVNPAAASGIALPSGALSSVPSANALVITPASDAVLARVNSQPAFANSISALGAGTYSTADFVNLVAKGLVLAINITAITGTTPTIVFTIQGRSASGVTYTILASAALNATGVTILRVYPGLTAAANLTASDVIPISWRLSWTIGGTGPAVTATFDVAMEV